MKISRKESIVWGGLLILFGALGVAESLFGVNIWLWVICIAVGGFGVYAYYATDRNEKSLLIISYAMLSVSLMVALIELNILQGTAIAALVLLYIALPFIYGYFKSGRTLWGLLIPAYALLAVALMLLLIETGVLHGILIAAFVNFAVALPFFYTYFRNKKQWWALIPGGVTAAVALSFLLVDSASFFGPAILIVAGVWVLLHQLKNKNT